jgi:hypothetical protein
MKPEAHHYDLRPIKACHVCGASYTLPRWDRLQPILNAVPGPEIRICMCGTELALDRASAESIADALPPPEPRDCGAEHTASRAEPPPEALAGEPPPDGCAVDRWAWAYRCEAATVLVAYAHLPLVPYPRPLTPTTGAAAQARDKRGKVLGQLQLARVLLEMLTANLQQQAPQDATDDPEPGP